MDKFIHDSPFWKPSSETHITYDNILKGYCNPFYIYRFPEKWSDDLK